MSSKSVNVALFQDIDAERYFCTAAHHCVSGSVNSSRRALPSSNHVGVSDVNGASWCCMTCVSSWRVTVGWLFDCSCQFTKTQSARGPKQMQSPAAHDGVVVVVPPMSRTAFRKFAEFASVYTDGRRAYGRV